jgi:hypothetical protein
MKNKVWIGNYMYLEILEQRREQGFEVHEMGTEYLVEL